MRSYNNKNRNTNRRLQRKQKVLFNLVIILTLTLIISLTGIIVKASDNNNETQLYKYYESVYVEENDTLWSIAERYNNGDESKEDYISNLRIINNIVEDRIYSGNHIVIYYYSKEYK